MGLNRVFGLTYVSIFIFHHIVGTSSVPGDARVFYCYAVDGILFFFTISFWTNNVMIAIVR